MQKTFSIQNCTFINNTAGYGGAIYSEAYYNLGTITGSTFINNSATGDYAAIYNYAYDGTIDKCIFINNTATNSVIHAYEAITVSNSIFVNNDVKRFISTTESPNVVADNNWWGITTDGNYQNAPVIGAAISVNYWYVLDLKLNRETGIATISLKKYQKDYGFVSENYALPSIKFKLEGINITVPEYIEFDENGEKEVSYTKTDEYSLSVIYETINLTKK